MTLKEWYEFNKDILNIGSAGVCILNRSYHINDTLLETNWRYGAKTNRTYVAG